MAFLNAVDLCASLHNSLSLLFTCSPAPSEGVRVQTPMMYPDGGLVDVFVIERDGQYIITDYGEALGWVGMQSVRGQLSLKQRRLVDDVCLTLGVELYRGQVVLRCTPETLGEGVQRLAQAVVRISDIWFTLRTRAAETVADEVGDWLEERHISFDRAVKQSGRSIYGWTLDYQTFTPARTSFIFLLSTGSRSAARRVTEHVAAGWVDLSHLKVSQPHTAFVSLFDDTVDVWRGEDFKLVEELSEVALWSRQDELEQILRAA